MQPDGWTESAREKRRVPPETTLALFFSSFFFDARQPFGTVVATEPVGSEFSALGDQRVRVQTSVMGLEEDKDFKFHKNAVAVLCNR